ncbi:MAG: 4Fe-4S binding protein [Desulfobacterales bacterium]|nr:4Fe-4S binding protein [Desulfobacterales bacterium]
MLLTRRAARPKAVGIIHCVGSPRQEHQRVLLAGLLHVLAEARAPGQGAHRRRRSTTSTSTCAAPGKGYEEFYNQLLEEGVRLHPRPGRRGHRLGRRRRWRRASWSSGSKTRWPASCARIPVDMVVLSTGLEAAATTPSDVRRHVQHVLRRARASSWSGTPSWRRSTPSPTASSSPGCCQGPKDIPDTVAQAGAAAAEALALIDTGQVELEPNTAYDRRGATARAARSCVPLCPYSAIDVQRGRRRRPLNEALCKGCGTCVAACPSRLDRSRTCSRTTRSSSEIEGVLAHA